jgi:hypothetical protein
VFNRKIQGHWWTLHWWIEKFLTNSLVKLNQQDKEMKALRVSSNNYFFTSQRGGRGSEEA